MRLIDADKLIDALGLWGCYKYEIPEAYDTLMKYEVLQEIEDQYDDEESKCEELADCINKIKFIVNFEVGNRHEIGEKILAVIDGSDEE